MRPAQSGERRSVLPLSYLSWVGALLAVLGLAAWLQYLSPFPLAVAGAGVLFWLTGRYSRVTWWGASAALALAAAVLVAAAVQLRLGSVEHEWGAMRVEIEENAAEALAAALDDLVDRGEQAVEGITEVVHTPGIARAEVFDRLESIRRTTAMAALAVYGPDGRPIAWTGEHRGMIPPSVRHGARMYVFHRGPVFGYLYFTHELSLERTAVAAVLLTSSIPTDQDFRPFTEHFAANHGVTPVFSLPDQAEGDAVWDWATDRPIMSVSFVPVTQEAWYLRVANSGRRGIVVPWMLGAILLCIGWYRVRAGSPALPVLALTAALLLVPYGQMLVMTGAFSPLHFVLVGPGDVTLAQLLILLTGLAVAWLATTPLRRGTARFPSPAAVAVAALIIPAGLELVVRSAALGMLAVTPAGGLALVLATTLLLAVPLFLLLRLPDTEAAPPRRTRWLGALAVGASLGLALAVFLGWSPQVGVSTWIAAFWAAPFAIFLLARRRGDWGALPTWLSAGWLGGSAALAFLWVAHMEARLEVAETEIAHLGTEADPYLDYLLRQYAERTLSLAAEGEGGVNLLYRSWVGSGLAREGYEARMSVWSDARPVAELRLSDVEIPLPFAAQMLERAAESAEPVLERYTERDFVHYLLLVPLPDDQLVSVVVPPRRQLGRATALARFLHPDQPAGLLEEFQLLSLVPLVPGAEVHTYVPSTEIRWMRIAAGWRSEAVVPFPAGPVHAHLLVRTPPSWIVIARGLLVQFVVGLAFVGMWSLARTLCGEPLGLPENRRRWLGTFRGRLTLALFGFFLVPTLIFGAVAYRALSQEVVRTAEALARRSLELAATAVPVEPLHALGARVRADLLHYDRGSLVSASAPELLDLGLFQSWLPPSIELAFTSAENLEAREEHRLAGHDYLVAYRRLDDDGVLAAPIPLASGRIARAQREFAHGFLLMMVLGAGLSVVLALLVGRALSQPIEMLSRAAVAVGGGNLRLRLPEDRHDEFGGVYRAFNRMVRRIRRARASEVRTARVLAWGEMARQVAHEIKNPLTPIKLAVQHIRRAHADRRRDFPEILDRNVDAVLREIDRLGEISRAFARFGTPPRAAGVLEPIDLEQVVQETLVLYRGGQDGLRYQADLEGAVPRVLARDGELREVLLNLLENAREAVGGPGEIRIRATPLGGGEWVRLEISDTGVGIPDDQITRIFEPHFSTRSSGTGLGLAIVRRLVESWGGEITVQSEPGVGTTFFLRMRAANGDGEVAPSEAGADGGPPRDGGAE